MKIIGNTVGMGLPKPNLMQTDPTKGDYVKGKEEFLKQANAGATAEEVAQIQQNKTNIEQLARDKLDAEKLPEAVNDALAQAKSSGDFKGDPGYTPQKGIDYFDGKDGQPGEPGKTPVKGEDYFTDADKQEMAELTAKMVDIPTDDHINSLINTALGVIENGTY